MSRLQGPSNKVEDAWALLRLLELGLDGLSMKAVFNALLVALRSVPDAIDRDLKPTLRDFKRQDPARGGPLLQQYTQWKVARLAERREPTSLLLFVETARDEDIHEGRHRILFHQSTITEAGTINPATDGPPGATSFVASADGAYWLVDSGTPSERRLPAANMVVATAFGVDNPPQVHLGQPLTDTAPLSLARLAVYYYARLNFDADQFLP